MLKHPLKPLLMASFIYNFFVNLEKVLTNFSRCIHRRKEKKRLFFPMIDLPILGGVTLPKFRYILWFKMYRFLPGPSFVWNQFILSWVRFVLDLYWPSHIWNEIYLYQILSMNVPNSIWTKFYLDTIYSKSTSIWMEFNHLCVPNFIGNVLMLSLKLVVYGMLM